TMLSSDKVASRAPSELRCAPITEVAFPPCVAISCPVTASHTRTLPSLDAVITCAPSGVKAALWTGPRWPLSATTSSPVAVSQSPAIPSADAVTTRAPFGLKAALQIPYCWPLKMAISFPVEAFKHTRGLALAFSHHHTRSIRAKCGVPDWHMDRVN